ncbi:MAG TPA: RNA polymerase sigma-70 factor [Verrucomicrobiae bacterium]|jgi:RNA polymerase sigma-70 factor (ECF subfamily)|nr:RNA polymerase sigma-70 factor [Verrucomicrobiae bacterium]
MESKDRDATPEKTMPQPAGDAGRLAAFDQYRGLLFSVAYRMLGSVADAEDMLQETYIRWQQAAQEGIRSPRAFLITIITRLCINHLQSARVQREEYVGEWLPEPLVTDPASDPLGAVKVDESLSMAFLLLLERLTPMERAVFLLREVFEYEYAEIAGVLGQTEANCRQILRRARQHVGDLRRRFDASARDHTTLLQKFIRATRAGELQGLVELLSSEVVLHTDGGGKAVALAKEVRGAEKVAGTIIERMRTTLPKNLVARMARINGKPGIVSYLNGKPFSALTVDFRDGLAQAIYVVTNPEKLARLPELPSAPV